MLTVEDGSGVAGANSYVSVSAADAYHEARGNTGWIGSDDAKEQAILRAMAALEARRWRGRRSLRDQALQWPRYGVVDRDGYELDSTVVPGGVASALCEMALLELASPGVTSPALDRATKREKVGDLEVEYMDGAERMTRYTVVDALMAGLVGAPSCVEIGRG